MLSFDRFLKKVRDDKICESKSISRYRPSNYISCNKASVFMNFDFQRESSPGQSNPGNKFRGMEAEKWRY